jgi:hypothetical protein
MNLANISDHLTELEKQNEAISFRLYLIENYNQQVIQWRNEVFECLRGLTKTQAQQLTMADFQPKPISKFIPEYLSSNELLSIYKSMEHILPSAGKYESELTFVISNFKHYAKKKTK